MNVYKHSLHGGYSITESKNLSTPITADICIGCTEQFMQGTRKLMALAHYTYIVVYVHALTRDHERAAHPTRGVAA